MSGLDYALLGLIALAAFLALRQIWRGKGRCGGACGQCSEDCPHRKS